MTFNDFPIWDTQSEVKNCVYAYVNKETQMAYIGQTVNLKARDKAHKHNTKAKAGSIDAELASHPLDFEVRILQRELPSTQSLYEYESFYVRTFDTYKNGYNKSDDGNCHTGENVKMRIPNRKRCKDANFNNRIGDRLKAFRLLRGLSLRELAKGAGVSVTTLFRIEKGEDTALSTIIKIEKVLDVKLY